MQEKPLERSRDFDAPPTWGNHLNSLVARQFSVQGLDLVLIPLGDC
jgi:hypothetical protein